MKLGFYYYFILRNATLSYYNFCLISFLYPSFLRYFPQIILSFSYAYSVYNFHFNKVLISLAFSLFLNNVHLNHSVAVPSSLSLHIFLLPLVYILFSPTLIHRSRIPSISLDLISLLIVIILEISVLEP